jgi:hypothetical protein
MKLKFNFKTHFQVYILVTLFETVPCLASLGDYEMNELCELRYLFCNPAIIFFVLNKIYCIFFIPVTYNKSSLHSCIVTYEEKRDRLSHFWLVNLFEIHVYQIPQKCNFDCTFNCPTPLT